jgi:hypothetical protein
MEWLVAAGCRTDALMQTTHTACRSQITRSGPPLGPGGGDDLSRLRTSSQPTSIRVVRLSYGLVWLDFFLTCESTCDLGLAHPIITSTPTPVLLAEKPRVDLLLCAFSFLAF